VNGAVRSAVAAAGVTWLAGRLLRRAADPVAGWSRDNYRGRTVRLDGGAAVVVGAAAGVLAAPARHSPALVLLGAAALAGGYDDLAAPGRELAVDKGWRGHLAALRAGRVSGGAVKVAVIGAASLFAVRAAGGSWRRALPDAALVAATANLVNLFDLRPGRAGKVALAAGVITGAGPAAALSGTVAGAAAAELPDDLAERTMLGDLGANALGALLGLRLAAGGPALRWGALAVVTALTAASERVSFSKVIERTPALDTLDQLGRALPAETLRKQRSAFLRGTPEP
jgi:hypothetical protein